MRGKRASRSSKRYLDDENNFSKLRIFIALIIVVAIVGVIIFVGNRNTNAVPPNPKQEIETVLNNTFSKLKEINVDEVNQYLDYELLICSFDGMILENASEISYNIQQKIFEKMKWTVEDVDIIDENAVAIVEVTNINFKTIVTNWMKEIVSINSAGVVITNELALEKLFNILSQENIDQKTIIKKVNLIKKEGKWNIEVNNDLRDLIFPGIDSVITVLNENI